MRKSLLFIASTLTLIANLSTAEILQFNNGDRLTGSLVSEADGKITFKSDLVGEITVSTGEATVVSTEDAPVDSTALTTDQGPAEEPPEATPEEEADSVAEQDAFNASIDKARSYVDKIVPEGWSGKFSFGLSFVDTSTTSEAWNANFEAEKESGKNTYKVYAFYNFTSQIDANAVQSKTLDKWGGGFIYQRDLSERWFLQSETDYLRDLVKDINHQATETISLGYKVIDTDDLTFTLLPGGAGQYIEAEGFDERWIGYVVLGEELKYVFSETFRLEQDAQIRLDPTQTSQRQFAFNGAFITNLNEWIEASLNYQYTYDTTVGPGSVKSEQQIIFAIGVPF